MFRRAWKVFLTFGPLCYKQVIALSPRRIKDKFSLVFSKLKFSQSARVRHFCENTREDLSLILLGLIRLHTIIVETLFKVLYCIGKAIH